MLALVSRVDGGFAEALPLTFYSRDIPNSGTTNIQKFGALNREVIEEVQERENCSFNRGFTRVLHTAHSIGWVINLHLGDERMVLKGRRIAISGFSGISMTWRYWWLHRNNTAQFPLRIPDFLCKGKNY